MVFVTFIMMDIINNRTGEQSTAKYELEFHCRHHALSTDFCGIEFLTKLNNLLPEDWELNSLPLLIDFRYIYDFTGAHLVQFQKEYFTKAPCECNPDITDVDVRVDAVIEASMYGKSEIAEQILEVTPFVLQNWQEYYLQ